MRQMNASYLFHCMHSAQRILHMPRLKLERSKASANVENGKYQGCNSDDDNDSDNDNSVLFYLRMKF